MICRMFEKVLKNGLFKIDRPKSKVKYLIIHNYKRYLLIDPNFTKLKILLG